MINKIILSAVILSITIGSMFALQEVKENTITSYMVERIGTGYITDLNSLERAEAVRLAPYCQNIELGFIGYCVFIMVFSLAIIGYIFRPKKVKDSTLPVSLTEC